MTLKIWNLKDELIYQNDNMLEVLKNYGIDSAYLDTDNQEVFETELLNDIFEQNNIQSSESYYEISDNDSHTKSLFFKS